jgi:hypothetical protein
MPTVRHAKPRARFAQLSDQQLAYLLDQPIREPQTEADGSEWAWWWIVESGQDRPGDAYHDRSALVLWQRHRAELLPLWKRLHGRRRHPLDCNPRGTLAIAEASARALHERRLAAEARRYRQDQ